MSKKEESAEEYANKNYYELTIKGDLQEGFEAGWDAAVNEAIKWLENNANSYIYNTTPSYPDAGFKSKVGGMCWINLKKFMEE